MAISAFHYIESVPDATPIEVTRGLLSRAGDETVAFALKADGIFCLFTNYAEP